MVGCIALVGSLWASAGAKFKAAAELYSQQRYGLALKAFAEITKKEPRKMAAALTAWQYIQSRNEGG